VHGEAEWACFPYVNGGVGWTCLEAATWDLILVIFSRAAEFVIVAHLLHSLHLSSILPSFKSIYLLSNSFFILCSYLSDPVS
jgi:hypothetical protein